MSCVRCQVSGIRCPVSGVWCQVSDVTVFCLFSFFSGRSGGLSQWRVCYQWGIPCLNCLPHQPSGPNRSNICHVQLPSVCLFVCLCHRKTPTSRCWKKFWLKIAFLILPCQQVLVNYSYTAWHSWPGWGWHNFSKKKESFFPYKKIITKWLTPSPLHV